MLNRRSLLKRTLLLPFLAQTEVIKNILAANPDRRFKIGACDWSIGKGSNIGAFEVAKEIGVDGIMVDMGGPGNGLHIRQKETRDAYLNESKRTGIAISSLALGVFNQVPFHSHPETEKWISDSIDAARHFKVKVLLLAFFNASDLRNDDKRKDAAVQILKNVAPKAAMNDIVLGIESYLDAREHLALMERAGSENVKVYFDFRNTADAGFDTVREFRQLGREKVCELHMKENGFLLDKGTINWKEVSKAIYDTGYTGDGWMQIEGALPDDADIISSYKHNLRYLKQLFNK